MNLKTRHAIELYSALNALDGYFKPVKDGDRECGKINVPYKFSGSLRRIIFRNIAKLKIEIEAYNAASQAMFKEVAGERDSLDEKNPEEAKLLAVYRSRVNVLADEEISVDLQRITEDALALDDNAIPGSVLAALDPIIDANDSPPLKAVAA